MLTLLKIVTFYFTIVPTVGDHPMLDDSKTISNELLAVSVYESYLKDFQKEGSFDAVLIVQVCHSHNLGLDAFYKFPVPKIVLTDKHSFNYKAHYNSEILVVVIMSTVMDKKLLEQTAHTLDGMRQVRLFAVAIDVADRESFKMQLLHMCEDNKMTRVLLTFAQSCEQVRQQLVILKPYPEYHWELVDTTTEKINLFPVHWWNLENKTLVTYAHQFFSRSIVYEDSDGKIQMNGFVVRFVQLFAECFNASLEMYQPVKAGVTIHFMVLFNMTRDEKLDFPMALHSGVNTGTSYLELNQAFIIVPCALPLTTQELFNVLLNRRFFGCVFATFLILSIFHSLVQNTAHGLRQHLNFLLNGRVFLGVLGQPFSMRFSQLASIRMVYFAIGIVGLNISALFAGVLNTLLTNPPNHRQIETISDLVHSPLKILMFLGDVQRMGDYAKLIESSFLVSNSLESVNKKRNGFDINYAYFTTTTIWNMQSRRQQFFSHKSFCNYPNLTLYPLLIWSIPLPANSPYKDALNFLVHRVHDIGLITAWDSSTFLDMRKLKNVSLSDPNPREPRKVLNISDFFWIWTVVVIGWACSFILFVVELEAGRRSCLSN